MDSRDFLHVAAGDVPLEPYSLDVLHFPAGLALSELSLSTLTTTGFEGLDELIAEHTPDAVETLPEPAPEPEPEPEPEPKPVRAPSPPRTTPLPVACKPAVPAAAEIIHGYPPLPIEAQPVGAHAAFDEKPLRPRIVFGPNPNAPKPVEAPPAPKIAAKPAVAPKPVQSSPAASPVVTRPPQPTQQPTAKPAPVVQPAAAVAPLTPAAKPASAAPPPAAQPSAAPRLAPQPTVTVKPPASPSVTVRPPAAAPPATPQKPSIAASAATAPPAVVVPAEKPAAAASTTVSEPSTKPVAPEKPKISLRPASTPSVAPAPSMDRDKRVVQRPAPSGPSRPAMAARDGSALTADRPEPEIAPAAPPAPAPQLKPKLVPSRRSEPPLTSTVAVEEFTIGMHQMEPSAFGKFWGNASAPIKAAVVAAALVIAVTAGYFLFRPSPSAEAAYVAGPTAISDGNSPGNVIGGGGWTTNWGADAPVNKGKQISLFRPSMSMTDYRFEFRGQIEKKAVGWIFRASNSKNYYVEKIEIIKPGANPILALVKYSVIKGVEGTHTQVMLSNDLKMDTFYRVRMDVKGNKFTTYIQDKLVDYWTDDQVKTGGAGFYTAPGELAQVRTSQIAYLSAN
ncbi:MAG: hypothetical protein ABJF23_02020 [Bryobacteraceae bacterium]